MGNLVQNTCCLCGCMFEGMGNNPWPLSDDINDRCCDLCNDVKVIPERLKRDTNIDSMESD